MRLLFIFAFFVLLFFDVLSQPVQTKIDQYLRNVHKNHIIPGFSVVVVKDNQIIFCKGYGVEQSGSTKLFTSSSNTGVGSITKSFTALAIMILAERGKLDINDPVIKYIPWFRTVNKEQSDKITIKMLLSNTSGLYTTNTSSAFDVSDMAIEHFVKELSSVYLYKTPGNSYEYSNTGFVVAGLVISKVSGMSYASFLKKEIFTPLGMHNTTTEAGKLNGFISAHYPSIRSVIPARSEPDFEMGEYAPAGSLLNSNAEDMGKYLVAVMSANKLITPRMKRTMYTGNVTFPGLSKEMGGDGSPFSYGLGWMISQVEGRTIIHHGGSTGRSSSFTMIDTANKTAACILMNFDMTFVDPYSYPTAFNIINNIMRLSIQLPLSDFGRPASKDPTLNTFEVNNKRIDPYVGEYTFSKGGDAFIYFGIDMKIEKLENGVLEGTIYRGKQVVNRFNIDFLNESLALSRNVGVPGYLKFNISPKGNISSAYFNNIEFIKKSPAINSEYKQAAALYGIDFSLPNKWNTTFTDSSFSSQYDNERLMLKGGIVSTEKLLFDSLFRVTQEVSSEIKYQGNIMSETSGPFIWHEKVYTFNKNNTTYHCIIAFTKSAKAGYWFALTTDRDFTKNAMQVMKPLISSFRVK